jgi:polar amino acid transport system substrate-binding protein
MAAAVMTSRLPAPRSAAAQTPEHWRVVCGEDFAPYVWTEGARIFGLDVEICEKVLSRLGVLADINPMPWPRAVATLEAGAADLLLQFVATEERFAQFIMVGPFRNGETVFAVRADSPLRFDRLEDLRGLTIGTSRGFSYNHAFDEATDFIREPAATARLSLRKLVSGRVDMVVGDHIALAWLARRENIFDRIRFLPRPLSTVPRYFGFPQDRAEKAARFEQALRELQVDGTIPALIDRWRETG